MENINIITESYPEKTTIKVFFKSKAIRIVENKLKNIKKKIERLKKHTNFEGLYEDLENAKKTNDHWEYARIANEIASKETKLDKLKGKYRRSWLKAYALGSKKIKLPEIAFNNIEKNQNKDTEMTMALDLAANKNTAHVTTDTIDDILNRNSEGIEATAVSQPSPVAPAENKVESKTPELTGIEALAQMMAESKNNSAPEQKPIIPESPNANEIITPSAPSVKPEPIANNESVITPPVENTPLQAQPIETKEDEHVPRVKRGVKVVPVRVRSKVDENIIPNIAKENDVPTSTYDELSESQGLKERLAAAQQKLEQERQTDLLIQSAEEKQKENYAATRDILRQTRESVMRKIEALNQETETVRRDREARQASVDAMELERSAMEQEIDDLRAMLEPSIIQNTENTRRI